MKKLWLGVLLFSTACAGGAFQARPGDIVALEQRVAAAPDDNDARLQLGSAYVSAKRFDKARETLKPLADAKSNNAAVYLLLGAAEEELQHYTAAREAYDRYLDLAKSDKGREEVSARLALVARHEMREQAKVAIQRESDLSDQAPTPRSVAVFPFRIVSDDERLKPLQTALADMLITDLQLSGAVVSLERVRVQSMLDEMLLGEAGYTTPETGARAGRLLRAETVVQGVVTAPDTSQIRMDASVLNVAQRSAKGEVGTDGRMNAVFDLEKKMVFDILDVLGIQLTPTERERINENRTQNLIAFLAYGQGLQAADRGDFSGAQQYFRQATQLDPAFARAAQQQQEVVQLQQATSTSTEQVATQTAQAEAPALNPVAQASTSNDLVQQTINDVNPSPAQTALSGTSTVQQNTQEQGGSTRNSSTESGTGGGDGVSQATKARITITIPRPN